MKLGIDILLDENSKMIEGKRIGILAHAASFTSDGRHSVDALCGDKRWKVAALFGPEHGIETKAQDMESVDSSSDARLGLKVHSLYGNSPDSLSPTDQMLSGVDALVIDLQDVGARYYTYVWTAVLCMRVCAKLGIEVIVCDRPNPIGGVAVEGGPIENGFESFVGLFSVPVRHGMTIGEIVQLVNDKEDLNAKLSIIMMDGWRREFLWPETGLKWQNPSPNMRSMNAAILYPGMCLIEATNLSEGRGTDSPFILIGAPYVDGKRIAKEFNNLELAGVRATQAEFTPRRQKWAGQKCDGVKLIVKDRQALNSYAAGLALVWLMHKLYAKRGFEWRKEPYEFVKNVPAIDLLTGSASFREKIDNNLPYFIKDIAKTPQNLLEERKRHLIY